MNSPQLKKLAVISTLLALTSMAFVPAVLADPINANLTWSPDPITSPGGTSTATFGVNNVTPTGTSDPDCPTGQTFTGTLTVTEPDGISVSTVTISTPTPCGTTTLTAVYPTDFVGSASTSQCGVYKAEWAGTTSALVGGLHPSFDVINHLVVECPTVPQFGATPVAVIAAMGLLLVAALRNKRILKV